MEYTPIIFAPLVAYDESNKEDLELSILDKDCHCDKERAGFGNACALQESIELPGGLKSPKNPGYPQTVSAFLIFFVVNGIVLTCLSSPQNLDLGSGKIHEDPVFSCQHVLQFYFSIESIS